MSDINLSNIPAGRRRAYIASAYWFVCPVCDWDSDQMDRDEAVAAMREHNSSEEHKRAVRGAR